MAAWEKAETFEAYLEAKKIDASAWQSAHPKLYATEADYFTQTGPLSYDQQRKFKLMDWRLAFPLALDTKINRQKLGTSVSELESHPNGN
jgi:hypothetical protein